jgi:uncharacterized protein (TIGR00255 family)
MIRSMTGYGKAEVTTAAGRLTAEIRSVNHRYGEVTVKLPRQFLAEEAELRRRVAERLKRGKIDLFLQLEQAGGGAARPGADLELAKAYHDLFDQVRSALGLTEPVPLGLVLAQKDVLTAREESGDAAELSAALRPLVDSALESLEAMRCREGEMLAAEIVGRMSGIRSLVTRVADRAPVAVAANGARMRERLARLMGELPVDEARVAQELAVLADRMDVTEELVRLGSHFRQFDDLLASEEPVGRKLDFLIQELNREVNTVGSKANDAEIASLVVELKSELEKVREQVQNIE